MAGHRIPFLRGSYIRRDHIPPDLRPYTDIPTGDDATLYPVGFTLDEILQLCWVGRHWQVTGTVSFTEDLYLTSGHVSEDGYPWGDSVTFPADDENDLPFCRRTISNNPVKDSRWNVGSLTLPPRVDVVSTVHNSNRVFDDDDGWIAETPFPGSFKVGWGAVSSASYNAIYGSKDTVVPADGLDFHLELHLSPSNIVYYDPDENLFWPKITGTFYLGSVLERFVGGGDVHGGLLAVGTSLALYDSVSADAGSVVGSITIMEKVIPLYNASVLLDVSGLTTREITASVLLTLEPTKWWGYSTKAGDPVYDSDSGVFMDDPFA